MKTVASLLGRTDLWLAGSLTFLFFSNKKKTNEEQTEMLKKEGKFRNTMEDSVEYENAQKKHSCSIYDKKTVKTVMDMYTIGGDDREKHNADLLLKIIEGLGDSLDKIYVGARK